MIKEAIAKVVAKTDLTEPEAEAVMREIMQGEATDAQIAAYITALRMKGETVDEITGSARVMREKAVPVRTDAKYQVDTCGTGGDMAHTFNISTTVAFVVAGAGVTVAKHGNRSVSSKSGSADVLQALGINIEIPAHRVEESLREVGIGFLFAPLMHQAMKYAIGPRREIGIRTIFNILGPLTNPAGAPNTLMGVFHPDLVGIQVRVMQRLGAERVLVVHGKDNLDEISLGAATLVGELKDGDIREYEVHPEDFGLQMMSLRNLRVGSAEESKATMLGALDNKPGAAREIVCLNAGAALYVANVADSIGDGIVRAREAVASGAARAKVDQFVQCTRKLAGQ